MRNAAATATALALATLLPLLPLVAGGGEPPARPAMGLADLDEAAAAQLPPLQRAMRELLTAEREQLARLQANFDAAPDARAALELERRIAALKLSTELELLRLQATDLRERGREAEATALEARLELHLAGER